MFIHGLGFAASLTAEDELPFLPEILSSLATCTSEFTDFFDCSFVVSP